MSPMDSPNRLFTVKLFHQQAASIVDEDKHHHHREEFDLAPGIEHKAAQKQRQILQFCRGKIIKRQRDGQKTEQKQNRAEDQKTALPFTQKAGTWKTQVSASFSKLSAVCLISEPRPARCRFQCSRRPRYWRPPSPDNRPSQRCGRRRPWPPCPQIQRTGRRWRCWSCRFPFRP